MSNTLGPVDRDKANLEAEGGETVMTPAGDDGIPKFFKIGGQRHSQGGTPLYLPENSFIFSDTRSMLLGKNMLEEFGITGKKKKTPAEVAKILGKGYEKYVKIIQDPNSDSIERRTAEMMIQTQINNLGKLALAQESKKGFPQGIPMISVPYMASIGVSAEQLLPQIPQGMPQGNMMPPEMMQQMMQMQQMPMAKYGLQKYQVAGETNVFGDPNAPFPTSSPSTPEDRNIAQYILGNLQSYFTSKPEEESIEANIKPVEIVSPVKGFETIEDVDAFILKGDEFGQDFNALYNAYSQSLQAIDKLRYGLLNGTVPLEEYEKERDAINSRIDEIKTELKNSGNQIPWYKSSGIIHNSTVDILENMQGIMNEEKNKLKVRAADLRKFRTLQNNVSFLETEKQKILKLLNSDIDDLEKVRLRRRLTNLNDALNYETDRTNQFGERAFKIPKPTFEDIIEETETSANLPVINSRFKTPRVYGDEHTAQWFGPLAAATGKLIKKYTYDDYIKDYESNSIGTTVKPSYESQQGTLNNILSTATPDTAAVPVQNTVPTQTAPATTPSQPSKQTKSNSSNSNNNKSFISKIKKVEDKDLDLFKK
jgi:hypothetical protein